MGAELAEPTGNVTAVDWTGASFRGEGLGASSAYDPASFTAERCAAAIRAGVAAVLNDLTGIVIWLDEGQSSRRRNGDAPRTGGGPTRRFRPSWAVRPDLRCARCHTTAVRIGPVQRPLGSGFLNWAHQWAPGPCAWARTCL